MGAVKVAAALKENKDQRKKPDEMGKGVEDSLEALVDLLEKAGFGPSTPETTKALESLNEVCMVRDEGSHDAQASRSRMRREEIV
jgi:hypothetical protein